MSQPLHRGEYPPDWPLIAVAVKNAANWTCIRCGHAHDPDPAAGYILTVHHCDGDKANVKWWNLLALCQRCHLSVQARVNPDQPYWCEHSEWFKPYVAGFYAWKYLGIELTRGETEEKLDVLLRLERMI